MNASLRDELLTMAEQDRQLRAELAADGSLFEGYHPRMRAVHDRNAARLAEIIQQHGWPGRSLVGEDGMETAWLVLQHAIAQPSLQRRGLELLRAAVEQHEAPLWQLAYLEDRVRVFEGRPQTYGTQFDWDEKGQMSPQPIEDAAAVDERRRAVDLGSLEEAIRQHRQTIAGSNEKPPTDWAERQREFSDWARSAGWRE